MTRKTLLTFVLFLLSQQICAVELPIVAETPEATKEEAPTVRLEPKGGTAHKVKAPPPQCVAPLPRPAPAGRWAQSQVASQWEAGVEPIYWKTMQAVNNFVSKRNVGDGFISNLMVPFSPDYQWGVRPYLLFRGGDLTATLSYLFYQVRDIAERRSPDLTLAFPQGPAASGVRGELSFDYQNIDLRIGYSLGQWCGVCTTVYVNGRWLDLSRRQLMKAFAPASLASSNLNWESFRGGAVGAGVRLYREIGCHFAGFAEASPLVAIGRQKDNLRQVAAGTGFITTRSSSGGMACAPAFECRLGGELAYELCAMTLALRFGYEVNYYFHVFPQATTVTDLVVSSVRRTLNCEDIGFAGPFIGLQGRY